MHIAYRFRSVLIENNIQVLLYGSILRPERGNLLRSGLTYVQLGVVSLLALTSNLVDGAAALLAYQVLRQAVYGRAVI